MPLSVKNKIRWGTVFLFFLVMMSGGVGIYYLVKLRIQSSNVLTANYVSLQYAHRMQEAIDSMGSGRTAFLDTFRLYLGLQERNITEPGEREATAALERAFSEMKNDPPFKTDGLHGPLQQIISLNMSGMQRKYAASEDAAEQAMTIIVTIIAVILVIGFTFAVNFPSVITEPINKLTEAIQQIGRKNYQHRVYIQSRDEFGQLASSFNEMAERLEYFESSNLAQMIFEKSRAEAVINSLKDASVGIDKTDTVLFANQQALQILGLLAKDIVGMKVDVVAKRNDLFRFLIESNSNSPFKIIVDNRENYFIKEIIQVEEESGGSRVIVLKNITSFKELDVAKTNFIATVSHELKTPLASSDLSIKLLEDGRTGDLSEEQKELVQSLKADNQRMLRILSELLNLTQVEAGKIKLNIQPVDIYKTIEGSILAVAGACREKKINIDNKLEPGLPMVQADPDKMEWVLNNLFTNGIKYSPYGGTILVEASVDNRELVISVSDGGAGIEETYLPRIFDRYFQVPGSADNKGSGIGLAICRELVEAMNGRIWATSTPGQGSIFFVSLQIV